MRLQGKSIIGQSSIEGTAAPIQAVDPSSNEKLEPSYKGVDVAHVDTACELSWEAFHVYRETSLEKRAEFLEAIAGEIEGIGDELITRATKETGLPRGRIEGEMGRTCNQMRLFASVVRAGEWLDVRIDSTLPDRSPMPRPDLRQRHIPLGPVAVFGASNFPLAFSVAGGDTASALAAGCPVIVKAHSAHPGTSELVGYAVQRAVKKCQLPEGVFSLLFGSGRTIGTALVANPRIMGVGFTGSRSGGTALMQVAQNRPNPIPVYAEMSSINPVFPLPHALEARAEEMASEFIASLSMGAGQFCTSPGLVIGVKSSALDDFVEAAGTALNDTVSQTMLTPGVFEAYEKGVNRLSRHNKIQEVARSKPNGKPNECQSGLFRTTATEFLTDEVLQEEVFGSASIVIECQNMDELKQVAEHLDGQLTVTLQMEDSDLDVARKLLPILELKAGRVLVNGWPTGVEVCHAMVHGGPYPATSDSRSTSVGSGAIFRFLRPVCYQALPENLLPSALRDDNPLGLNRLVDGSREG